MSQALHIIMNLETGEFYSESPILRYEAKRAGLKWNNASSLPKFARRFTRYKETLRRSQQISDKTGAICSVMSLLTSANNADKIIVDYQEHCMTMRAAAPSGEPARLFSVGGEGTWSH